MEFFDVINKRYSVRSYKNLPIGDEKILKVLNAGRIAPSAVNFQPWFFIVVKEKNLRQQLNNVYPRTWFTTAPVVIVICADHSQSWKRKQDGKDFALVDAAIAIDHMALQATDIGLGTCWVCNFDVEKCIELFNFPGNIEPVALLPLGYPDDTLYEKKKKNLDDVVFWDGFGNKK